ncbi:MAG: 4Fe-4S dicluster domain-containing protein [Candidatus Omnitrophica bacterium]|nr:4Fe-4S dicluster domain-containing protein [Candidatus Omnitrophota bacterium]
MKWFVSQDVIKAPIQDILERGSGQKVRRCYQCGKCSAGCPMSFKMEHLPNQIIRMIQLGMEKEVLSSQTIWLCASCLACTARCPREIDIAEIMDFLRRRAYLKRVKPKLDAKVLLFNKVFLWNVEWFGRLYEIALIGMFNMFSLEFFKDFSIAPKMFLMRKIGLFPALKINRKEIREIFKRSHKVGLDQKDK